MDQQISRLLPNRGFGEKVNRGRHWKDKLWVEQEGNSAVSTGWCMRDVLACNINLTFFKCKRPMCMPGSINWAGPVRWFRGTLQIVKGSPEFPPGHEVLIFHRPEKVCITFPKSVACDCFRANAAFREVTSCLLRYLLVATAFFF